MSLSTELTTENDYLKAARKRRSTAVPSLRARKDARRDSRASLGSLHDRKGGWCSGAYVGGLWIKSIGIACVRNVSSYEERNWAIKSKTGCEREE